MFEVLRDRPLRFLSVLAVEFAAQAFLVLELIEPPRSIGQPFPALHPFVIEAADKFVVLAFFFIPGHVGAAEGANALIFKMVGLPAAAGFTLAIVRRLRSLLVTGSRFGFGASLEGRTTEPRARLMEILSCQLPRVLVQTLAIVNLMLVVEEKARGERSS